MAQGTRNRTGQNYFGDSNFGVNGAARDNAGLSTSSTDKATHPKHNHKVNFKTHPANSKLHGKPMTGK